MIKILNFLIMKFYSESKCTNEETIYDNLGYQMEYHDLHECYDGYYDIHRKYEYWDYK